MHMTVGTIATFFGDITWSRAISLSHGIIDIASLFMCAFTVSFGEDVLFLQIGSILTCDYLCYNFLQETPDTPFKTALRWRLSGLASTSIHSLRTTNLSLILLEIYLLQSLRSFADFVVSFEAGFR